MCRAATHRPTSPQATPTRPLRKSALEFALRRRHELDGSTVAWASGSELGPLTNPEAQAGVRRAAERRRLRPVHATQRSAAPPRNGAPRCPPRGERHLAIRLGAWPQGFYRLYALNAGGR